MVVVRKNISVDRGEQRLFDEVRYFFSLTNDHATPTSALVFLANDRCNQENLIDQLKHGVGATRMPVDTLVFWRGRRHPTEPDLSAVGRRQDNVRALQRRELGQGSRRGEPGAAAVEQVFQRHPECATGKRDQEMGLDAVLELMEQRPTRQLAFQGAEGAFGLGQLDVLRPRFLRGLSLEIGAQQIRALARIAPDAPLLDQPPS